MIQAIFWIFIFLVALGAIIKLSKFAWKIVLGVLGLVAITLLGPPALVGWLVVSSLRLIRLEKLGIFLISLLGLSLPFLFAYLYGENYYDVVNFEFGKYFLTFPLFALCVPLLRQLRLSERELYSSDLISKKREEVYNYFFIGMLFTLSSAISWYSYFPEQVLEYYESYIAEYKSWIVIAYWLLGALVVFMGHSLAQEINSLTKQTKSLLSRVKRARHGSIEEKVVEQCSFLDDKDSKALFSSILVKHITDGLITEVELADGSTMLYSVSNYEKSVSEIDKEASANDRVSLNDLSKIVAGKLSLSEEDSAYFAETHMDSGSYHQFSDGKFFVSYSAGETRSCVSCGKTELEETPEGGEWYCSDICEETEELCGKIKAQQPKDFVSSAVETGMVLTASADAWVENQKMLATGSQGHGFAAENANNMIDKIKGKDATVIGGDNAKNGADRLVDGELIQTKYYATAARSVGAGFDGQGGDYKYLTETGEPMALEVPSDQYNKAVAVMEGKIREGKVPGISNPADAEKLVVKGSVTYDQARNITRFGTVESLSYDLAEGAVVGLSAAGISFGITVATCYLQDKDKSVALKAGLIQGAKTFGKTTTVFVGVQQLHRLDAVQSTLKNIDIQNLSPSLRNFVQKGTGTTSTAGANSALRGTVLTTVVVIAVTTGPDLLKLVRGRISSGQFVKNLAVVSTGAVGGVAGSFAGGAILSPLGPVGIMAGRVVGGMVGSAVTSLAAKHLTNKLIEDDRDLIMTIIIQQIEYQVGVFMLTADEIENLNENLQLVISDTVIEKIFASKDDRIAAANLIVKPIVVGIVKQRPVLTYSLEDISKEGKRIDRSLKYAKAA